MHALVTSPMFSVRRCAQWLLVGLVLVSTVWLGACSTTADSTVHRKSEAPLPVTGVRIVYLEKELTFETTDPRFNSAYVSRTINSIGKAFRKVLGEGLKARGIDSVSMSAPDPAQKRELPPEVIKWLRTEKPQWPVVFILPNGASLHCAPCTMRTSVLVQLDDKGQARWAATFKQPAFTGSVTVGEEAEHEHFAQEVLRELQAQLQGPGKPS